MVWIETLCNYTDLLLECSNQIEDLLKQLQEINDFEQPPMWLARLMFKLSEKKERILQVIYMMEFYKIKYVCLENLRVIKLVFKMKKRKILNEIEDELLDHIYTIRETCNNLRPPFLYELGLKQALINLFKQINLKATFSFIMIFLNELLHQVLNMNKQFIELCKSY